MQNPYQATNASPDLKDVATNGESKVGFARLAWQAPLIGLAFSIVFNIVARPLGAVGGFVFIASVAAGAVLSLTGLFLARKCSGILRHALCGLALNTLFVFWIIAMLSAVTASRDAAIKSPEAMEGLYQDESSPTLPFEDAVK
jgi:hypothetical protein